MPSHLSTNRPRIVAGRRQLYIITLALVIALGLLYIGSTMREGINLAFVVTFGYVGELIIFLALFALFPRWLGRIEPLLYSAIVVSLLVLGNVQIHVLYARGVLIPDKLGFLVIALTLWLVITLLGGFLALPFAHVRRLMSIAWVGMALSVLAAALLLSPPDEWRYSYLVSWVSGLVPLAVVSLLISWLGRATQRRATTDALTGLANRHQLTEVLAQWFGRAEQSRPRLAMMLIDVDHFKTVNDTCGHAAGDIVLREVAAAIQRSVRGSDYVGRWGGDEFLVLLVDNDPGAAQEAAERIRASLGPSESGCGIRCTLSIGVCEPFAGQPVEEALACADRALYAAKQAGRDRVRVWQGAEAV